MQSAVRHVLQAGSPQSSPDVDLPTSGTEHFVTIDDGGDFVIGCEKFYFTGWNQYVPLSDPRGATLSGPKFMFWHVRSHSIQDRVINGQILYNTGRRAVPSYALWAP